MSHKMFNALQNLVASGFKGRIAFVQDGVLLSAETGKPVERTDEFDIIVVDEMVGQEEAARIAESQLGFVSQKQATVIEHLWQAEKTRDGESHVSKAFRREFGKCTFGEAYEIAKDNHARRLKWAEEARLGRERADAAEVKRERRRQRNIRLQKGKS